MTEFSLHMPIPRRGLTSIEAVELMRREFPGEPSWVCWQAAGMAYSRALQRFVGFGAGDRGEVAGYHWQRRPCAYPELTYFGGRPDPRGLADDWTGVLEIQGPAGERFLLFSYLTASGEVGKSLLASTTDVGLLDRFGNELAAALSHQEDRVPVTVMGGRDLSLPLADAGPLFLPEDLVRDIEDQLHSFFVDEALFRRLRLRRRRGLLFVGPPGNGKTLMVRHLVSLAHREHGAQVFGLAIGKHVDADDVETLFTTAAERGPSLVVLEDLDSLLRESQVTRSGLLALLDGLEPREGVMVLATTNNPEEIDPALAQRPSRFDRVWRFDPPDAVLRRRFIDWAFTGLPEGLRARLAESTGSFSFAFLNELRVSAAILAIRAGREEVLEQDAVDALELLSVQFKAGKKGYKSEAEEPRAGFGPM